MKGTEYSAAEYLRHMQWCAFEMLGQHELLAEDYWDSGRGARWVIGKRGTFVHKCEIFAGIGGSLVVHGDFDVARFGHYGDHADAFNRLCWMGLCTDVSYYVAQKASIGLRGRGSVHHYDEDVAWHDLNARILDSQSQDDNPELVELLTEARDARFESEHELRTFLSERDQWDLWECHFGEVLDSHIIVSHIALNKCVALLLERHGALGPPACRESRNASSIHHPSP